MEYEDDETNDDEFEDDEDEVEEFEEPDWWGGNPIGFK
jgi:hypothetical protein